MKTVAVLATERRRFVKRQRNPMIHNRFDLVAIEALGGQIALHLGSLKIGHQRVATVAFSLIVRDDIVLICPGLSVPEDYSGHQSNNDQTTNGLEP
jgi:hypothetical protein